MDYWMKLFFFASNIFVSIYDTRNIIDTFQIYLIGRREEYKGKFCFQETDVSITPLYNKLYVRNKTTRYLPHYLKKKKRKRGGEKKLARY